MSLEDTQVREFELWLQRIQAGDLSAREQVIERACERLRRLTRKMLRDYPRLRRWEQTDDVLQTAVVRLHQSLAHVKLPSADEFFRFAALQIRRTLVDLTRHHFGPEGSAANHHSDRLADGSSNAEAAWERGADSTGEPGTLAQWSEFHSVAETLPAEEREVFGLLWYGGLSQLEAATVLGLSPRTIKRRWQSARLLLYERLQGQRPATM